MANLLPSVTTLRLKTVPGRCVILVAMGLHHAADVVQLRNQQAARYFLAQDSLIDVAAQETWYRTYAEKDNELAFMVLDAGESVVGTIQLYHITAQTAEFGRSVFDLRRTHGTPYVLEAVILILNLAFDQLNVREVTATVKTDNHRLLRFLEKMGFTRDAQCSIRGRMYHTLQLLPSNKLYQKYTSIVAQRAAKSSS